MARFWLVPVDWNGETAVLGAERIKLVPEELRERFVRSLQSVHPRLLLSFKANLLLSDEAWEACGTEGLPFDLEQPVDVVLNGYVESGDAAGPERCADPAAGFSERSLDPSSGFGMLSHCTQAYLGGLFSPVEAALKLKDSLVEPGTEHWRAAMGGWLEAGRLVMLLKED